METRVESVASGHKIALFILGILMCSSLPLIATPVEASGARDADIFLSVTPASQTINPGETAEYKVRVYNRGSNPVTVSLTAANSQDEACSGYSTTIGQIAGPIDAGEDKETLMNVTLSQTAEESCDTTVTATATEQVTPPDQPGQPATDEETVTTIAGDGSGSQLYGVDLILDEPSQILDKENEIEWQVEIENTGRAEETVELSISERDGPQCSSASSISIDISPKSVTVDNESSEYATITATVPDGQEAETYCWKVKGDVTNDPMNNATDTEPFDLEVPELHECTASLSKSNIQVKPGETGTVDVKFKNDGNSDWTVSVGKFGSKAGWVSVDGQSSGLLPYDDGDGEKSFTLEVTPDSSDDSGSEHLITIQGKDGGQTKCSTELRVKLGQNHGASISIDKSSINNVQPGSTEEVSITVTNQGNGQDILRLSSSGAPVGWKVTMDASSVNVGSKHSSDKSASVGVSVEVPSDALADDAVVITFSVSPNNGGQSYDTVDVQIKVAAVHGIKGSTTGDVQTGRSDSEVKFPMLIENTGNVEDQFRFYVKEQTEIPAWGVHFEEDDGTACGSTCTLNIPARTSMTVWLIVSVDGEEEGGNQITTRVTNKGASSNDADGDGMPDNEIEFKFIAYLSDRVFSMDVRMEDAFDGKSSSVTLPPSGSATFTLWVINKGDGNDEAQFTFSGLEGVATRQLIANGKQVDGTFSVPKGWGVWNTSLEGFVYDSEGSPLIGSTKNKAEQVRVDHELISGHEVRPYEVRVYLVLTASSSSENGQGGLLEMVVTSTSNAANRSAKASVSLTINTIEKVRLKAVDLADGSSIDGLQSVDLTYPSSAEFLVSVSNAGNIQSEVKVEASDNIAGWTVLFEEYEHSIDACEVKGDGINCVLEEGEEALILVIVKPPHGAELAEKFEFTLSAEPVNLGLVGRQNLEFEVSGEAEPGWWKDNVPGFGVGLSLLALLGAAMLLSSGRQEIN